ncbi:MAG: 2-succinyl-5-enolpyruvyl-6-hydroxy-3-cyclohexene-1-carboxylate synthase [Flavobacteriaceae bacterium]
MKISNIPAAQLIIENCRVHGIKHIIISPGSRSAPLTLSFTAHPDFKCHSVVDERSAAFYALGMAQQLKSPVALVCTSGSAVLNYLPAIAEAYYSNIPLLVLSADRPSYRIDIGDGQTIRQDNIMGSFTAFSATLQQDVKHATANILMSNRQQLVNDSEADIEELQAKQLEANQQTIYTAFGELYSSKLPVHLNIPFEEPLYGLEEYQPKDIIPLESSPTAEVNTALPQLLIDLQTSSRVLILVGVLDADDALRDLFSDISKKDQVLIFSESLSNIKRTGVIENIDVVLAPIERQSHAEDIFGELQPDLLITVGGLVVSKKVKNFLRKYSPQQHYHLGDSPAYDTYFKGVTPIGGSLMELLSAVEKKLTLLSQYRSFGQSILEERLLAHNLFKKKVSYSDFYVFQQLWRSIPTAYQIHMANSSAVRYAQLFDSRLLNNMYCNRGTSGIDGSISTALGAAIVNQHPTLCISGDLSFFYDSNALWKNEVPSSFRLIIINNTGGGIFRILPDTIKDRMFEIFFETQHKLNAKHFARMHGWKYRSASSAWKLKSSLKHFFRSSNRPQILEIFTPSRKNPDVLSSYFEYLAHHKNS